MSEIVERISIWRPNPSTWLADCDCGQRMVCDTWAEATRAARQHHAADHESHADWCNLVSHGQCCPQSACDCQEEA